MTLGVANAFLDRSPLVAITATHAHANAPYATHQNLDLNGVYRPITKLSCTLDGWDTAAKTARALQVALAPRRGPVHLALPSDVAGCDDRATSSPQAADTPVSRARFVPEDIDRIHAEIRRARRPIVILGFDLDAREHGRHVRTFIEGLDVPTFVTPKAKGILPEDHPLFCGVCAGVAADAEVLECFHRGDLLIGIGFDPVESDKVWHHAMRLISISPMSIAARGYRPFSECVGDLNEMIADLEARGVGPFEWTPADFDAVRAAIDAALRPPAVRNGLSGYELTRQLRERFPPDTIFTTDVGSLKMVTAQAWRSYEPGTFLVSNGLSAMGYSLPAAIAARLNDRERPVLCTIGDGGFAMTIGELETCVREQLDLTIVVFNDSSLSLIDVAQQRRGYPTVGVRFSPVDFAAAARGFGAWARRVETMDDLAAALREAPRRGPVVIDAVVDPAEYARQTAGHRAAT
jgi:acetolactate synthase-1/2/3 large subunit